MILQNIVFPPDEICEKDLYIRGSNILNKYKSSYCLQQGGVISTDTYMNAFDISTWKKYAKISSLSLAWKLKGKGILKIYWEKEHTDAVCLAEIAVENCDEVEYGLRHGGTSIVLNGI